MSDRMLPNPGDNRQRLIEAQQKRERGDIEKAKRRGRGPKFPARYPRTALEKLEQQRRLDDITVYLKGSSCLEVEKVWAWNTYLQEDSARS